MACLAVAFGCAANTDSGTPCTLLKSDGSTLTEGELTPGVDYVSFGVAVCENLVCVRDANVAFSGNPKAGAVGYCSRSCAAATDCRSATSVRLSCRELLLDTASSANLGGSTSPFYCAAVR